MADLIALAYSDFQFKTPKDDPIYRHPSGSVSEKEKLGCINWVKGYCRPNNSKTREYYDRWSWEPCHIIDPQLIHDLLRVATLQVDQQILANGRKWAG